MDEPSAFGFNSDRCAAFFDLRRGAAYSEANCAEQLTGEELDLLLISRQDISKHWKYLHSQVRQRVETCFSLLWNRFIQRVFSRSWLGLWNTIQLKVLHYNLCNASLIQH